MGVFTIDELIDIHKQDCNLLKYGKCDSRSCLIHGGWKRGMKPKDISPTCEALETVQLLQKVKAEGTHGTQTTSEQKVEGRTASTLRVLGPGEEDPQT